MIEVHGGHLMEEAIIKLFEIMERICNAIAINQEAISRLEKRIEELEKKI